MIFLLILLYDILSLTRSPYVWNNAIEQNDSLSQTQLPQRM